MEVLHAAPYKVLHLEYNEVKVLARLQKLVRKVTPQMCCCFCRKFTLLFCSQGGREVPSTSLAGICHSISVRVSAPWLEGELCSCLFMLHEELLSLCSGFMTKPLIVHSGSDASVSVPESLLTNV